MPELYAEDVGHYWKTGTPAPDTWIDRAKNEIRAAKGKILSQLLRGLKPHSLSLAQPLMTHDTETQDTKQLPRRMGH